MDDAGGRTNIDCRNDTKNPPSSPSDIREADSVTDESGGPSDSPSSAKDYNHYTEGAHSQCTGEVHADTDSIYSDEDDDEEPFETFQLKVREVCAQRGLTGIILEDLKGGSYNRVVAIECGPDLPSTTPVRYILRVPNDTSDCTTEHPESEPVKNLAALLRFLTSRMPSSTADIVAFDSTKSNALSSPYILQHRLPGIALDNVYSEMSVLQKIDIAQQVAELLITLESIKFPAIGHIIAFAEPTEPWNTPGMAVSEDSLLRIVELDTKPPSRWHTQVHVPPAVTIEEFFERQFAQRITEEGEICRSVYGEELYNWGILLGISREMTQMGWFDSGQPTGGILHHWDFEPRNIIVEFQQKPMSTAKTCNTDSGHWKITGLVDWDDALSYPCILAHKPPIWLWNDYETFSLFHQWINDDGKDSRIYDQWDYDLDTAPPLPLSKDGSLVKRAFDAEMEKHLPGYCRHAYGEGKMVRRLAEFAKMKGMGNWEHVRYERFLKEWESERIMWLERHGMENDPTMP